jgi:hypothetical protein
MSAATLATIASQNVVIFSKDPSAIFYVIMKPDIPISLASSLSLP